MFQRESRSSTVAASLVATPRILATAQALVVGTWDHDGEAPLGSYEDKMTVVRPERKQRSWHEDERFERCHAQNRRNIDYREYRTGHLYAPARCQQRVRSGNDPVLVAAGNGIVAAVVADAGR